MARRLLHARAMSNAQARRLDDVLECMQLLWAIEHRLRRASKLMHRRTGLTGPQRLVLRIVQDHPGIAPSELVELVHLHKSTLTGILRRLEHQHLLVRTADADDRRRAHIYLDVEPSRDPFERSSAVLESAVATALSSASTTEREITRRVLGAIAGALGREIGRLGAPS